MIQPSVRAKETTFKSISDGAKPSALLPAWAPICISKAEVITFISGMELF